MTRWNGLGERDGEDSRATIISCNSKGANGSSCLAVAGCIAGGIVEKIESECYVVC